MIFRRTIENTSNIRSKTCPILEFPVESPHPKPCSPQITPPNPACPWLPFTLLSMFFVFPQPENFEVIKFCHNFPLYYYPYNGKLLLFWKLLWTMDSTLIDTCQSTFFFLSLYIPRCSTVLVLKNKPNIQVAVLMILMTFCAVLCDPVHPIWICIVLYFLSKGKCFPFFFDPQMISIHKGLFYLFGLQNISELPIWSPM